MRHVPTKDIRSFSDISFENALKQALEPSCEYDVNKWLFVPNSYDEYRYILGTRGQNPLICIGINPSTAAPDKLDPTLKSAQRIALNNGYDSFMMMNVYAQRATEPALMDAERNETLHAENLNALKYLLTVYPGAPIWAAWGNIIELRPYLLSCAADMIRLSLKMGASWYCCGAISKKGHPHHPLYLKATEPLKPFDAQAYIQGI